jgi:hypothetical protein
MAKKKKWIQEAIKRPGALTKKAKAQDKTIAQYCASPNLTTRSKRQCALAKTLKKVRPKKK